MIQERSQFAILRLMNRGAIERLSGPVRQGKESTVLYAVSPRGKEMAVKVHTSLVFGERQRKSYLFGDWRLRHAKRRIISETNEV